MQEPPNSEPPGRRFGTVMIILAWVAALAIVALLMQQWLDQRRNPNSQLKVQTSGAGVKQLVLKRNPYGHYVANGTLNGHDTTFMLDTGATDVVVPASMAGDYGLERGYPVQVTTANGTVTAYVTTIDRLTLGPESGPLTLREVRANINPHMEGDEVLLGMSFLKHLNMNQSGDKLVLSKP